MREEDERRPDERGSRAGDEPGRVGDVRLDDVDALAAESRADGSQAGRPCEAGILPEDATMDLRVAVGDHPNVDAEGSKSGDARLDEGSERRMRGARVEIGDDEDPHALRPPARRHPRREPARPARSTSLAGGSSARRLRATRSRSSRPRGDGEMARLVERRDGIRILRYPQRAASGLGRISRRVRALDGLHHRMAAGASTAWTGSMSSTAAIRPTSSFCSVVFARLFGARYVFDQHDVNPELAATKWGTRRSGRFLVGPDPEPRASVVLGPRPPSSSPTIRTRALPPSAGARARPDRGRPECATGRSIPRSRRRHRCHRPTAACASATWRHGIRRMASRSCSMGSPACAISGRTSTVEVDLVGDGEARRALERRADDLGIAPRVRFHGYQGPEAFVPLLAATHVCVSPDPPTPFNDVSTMAKVVDYLAIGRPVVAFALTETIGIVGDAGSIVDRADGGCPGDRAGRACRRPRPPRPVDSRRRSEDRRPRSVTGKSRRSDCSRPTTRSWRGPAPTRRLIPIPATSPGRFGIHRGEPTSPRADPLAARCRRAVRRPSATLPRDVGRRSACPNGAGCRRSGTARSAIPRAPRPAASSPPESRAWSSSSSGRSSCRERSVPTAEARMRSTWH